MSWNFAIAGHDKRVVKIHIQKQDRVPEYMRKAICDAIDSIPDDKPFVVESAGHVDTTGGNAKFSIRTQQTIITQ